MSSATCGVVVIRLCNLSARPAYADLGSEETVDSDPHESQLAGDEIGDDGGMR
ncbi:hypothetical protein Hdeb2414_s0003g00082441 [Helianthus debilis subsp. tardiflorus]